MANSTTKTSFFLRHEFAIRRFHSLIGIVPLGLYMVIHLTTNASLLNSTETFQRAVYMIHSAGKALPIIEWGGIFAPLLFHGILGIWIAKNAKLNTSQYRFTSNRRYAWQRWTGIIALVYLFMHIWHMHGWFHFGPYLDVIRPLQMASFRPYNAASTLAESMNQWGGFVWPAFYLVGILACVYHLANGLWTAGITWGLWISPAAQARASKVSVVFGAVLTVIALSAWWAAVAPGPEDVANMRTIEDRMYKANVEAGVISDLPEKRSAAVTPDTAAASETDVPSDQ
ncbi:succinate dehydrogenase cytochrome b558 subunit [Novipirellula galeiformis]|nr:succinate dehydrogenase cytochrome b558 subunit [Novipirellula galeiformis]